MHESNLAKVFKMAQWTKGTLAKRDAPYSAASSEVTFVTAGLQVNQVTGTVYPKTIDVDPDTDDDDENLYNPLAFAEVGDGPGGESGNLAAAKALARAGAREMRRGRVFLAPSAAIAEMRAPPRVLAVDVLPQPVNYVGTSDAARNTVDAELASTVLCR